MSYDIYTGLLKAFPMRSAGAGNIHFSYDNNNPHFEQLKSKYPIEKAAGDGDDFSKATGILNWISEHICYKGNYTGIIAHNALDLLDYTYDKGNLFGVNCVSLSAILAECLLAVGLAARRVFLMPCSPYDGDFHAVVNVYISQMKKWVMLDPVFCDYFTNEAGECLSLLELRSCLAEQKPIFSEGNAKENIEYFAKNLFYFETIEKSTYNEDETVAEGKSSQNRIIILSPEGYDPKETRKINLGYRELKFGNNPRLEAWKKRVNLNEYIYCPQNEFEAQP